MELHPYQLDGVKFLSERAHAYLCDEMGLGKSAQAIVAASTVRVKSILVIAPASAVENWKREFKFWAPHLLPVLEVHSYEMAVKLKSQLTAPTRTTRWDLTIIDEAHYLKSPDAKRTHAILGVGGIAHHAHRTWLLSGTPMPNHAGELWVVLRTFGLTSYDYEDYLKRYCNVYQQNYHWKPRVLGTKQDHIHEVKTALSKLALRRTTAEVLKDLPPINFQTHYLNEGDFEIELSPSMREKLNEELTRIAFELSTDLDDERLIATLEVLAKSVSTIRRYNGLKKAKAASELVLEELQSNAYQKIILFCAHRAVAQDLEKSLIQYFPVVVQGDTPQGDRMSLIDRFNLNPECRVFIGNIQAAGVAINLTAANQVLFVEQSWTPADNAQAAKRAHRIGQKLPVFVRTLSIANTIDEKISATLSRKMADILRMGL